MDNQNEVRNFLSTRRARLSPEQAGIIGGGRRRVAGLRREEVAMLAGVSTDYYIRMERGNLAGVSGEILDAICAALRLDDTETDHFHDLARAAGPTQLPRRSRRMETAVRPSLQRLLDSITEAPAWVMNARKDMLATNVLGQALMSPVLDDPANQSNNARFIFLSTASRLYYPDWDAAADSTVASMRHSAGRDPHDKPLTDLVGELVTRSDAFRQRWARHDVRLHRDGTKRIRHPDVGDLEFVFEGMELPGTPGWIVYVYTSAADSPTAERVQLLGSLATTRSATHHGAAGLSGERN